MLSKSVFVGLVVLSVVAVAIQTAAIQKREVKPEDRPEAPLVPECEDPGTNRENCFSVDPSVEYLKEIADWEKKNPAVAEAYNTKNPDTKKKEQDRLAELEKLAKIHEEE